MNAYIFQSDLFCDECIAKFKAANAAPSCVDPDDEGSYDSDEWPKGPYADGGGEADTPQHCGDCLTFLENPLTTDGAQYVLDALAEHAATGRGDPEVLAEWSRFYGITLPDPDDDCGTCGGSGCPECCPGLGDDE